MRIETYEVLFRLAKVQGDKPGRTYAFSHRLYRPDHQSLKVVLNVKPRPVVKLMCKRCMGRERILGD